jgi:hypothetical protein
MVENSETDRAKRKTKRNWKRDFEGGTDVRLYKDKKKLQYIEVLNFHSVIWRSKN